MEGSTRYICDEYPNGFPESMPLSFHSPYGCSKGSADQYLQDFARLYDLKTVVFRHSSIYGENQHSTIKYQATEVEFIHNNLFLLLRKKIMYEQRVK